MFCGNCGKKLDDDARFCSGCGSAVGQSMPVGNQPNVSMKKPLGKLPVIIGVCTTAIIIAISAIVLVEKIGFGDKDAAPANGRVKKEARTDRDSAKKDAGAANGAASNAENLLGLFKDAGNDGGSDKAEKRTADDGQIEVKLFASEDMEASAPAGAIDNWNYTLDGGYVTLNYYNGYETDVTVYASYLIEGKAYRTRIASSPGDDNDDAYMFNAYAISQCENIASIIFEDGIDTSNVTSMDNMFVGCSSLRSLDVSSLDTSNVTSMVSMFTSCSSLTSLDLSSFDTSNVTDMAYMFLSCSSLTSLDVSSFDTSNVTNMIQMFASCTSLRSLDLSSFNTSNVVHMSYMFTNCSSLTSLDLSSFNTSNVGSINDMFASCSSLRSLDLRSFDLSKVSSFEAGNALSRTSQGLVVTATKATKDKLDEFHYKWLTWNIVN